MDQRRRRQLCNKFATHNNNNIHDKNSCGVVVPVLNMAELDPPLPVMKRLPQSCGGDSEPRKEITSYFQHKKKQTTTCEDEEPSAASIEVTGDGVEPLIFGGINRNSEQNPQDLEIVNEGIDSENTDEIIDFNSLIRDPGFTCG
ncbi:hypothetical protein AgCh_009259 [Apium graveolens]